MTRAERIDKLLREEFSPSTLEVSDFSHQHRAGPDAQSHIDVYIVSSVFNGLNMVQKHRMIYGLLKDEMSSGLHALKLQVFGEDEAAQPASSPPKCKGG